MAVYFVPYKAGELKGLGYDKGKEVNNCILKTANEPTQSRLTADRDKIKANNEDLSYIMVELVDANGVRKKRIAHKRF
jgi:beta-galactosidase